MKLVTKYILRTGIKYGITGSIILVIFYSSLIYFDENVLAPGLVLLIGLLVVILIFASLYEYNQVDAIPRFWKNMSVGMLNFIVISIVYVITMTMILHYVQPEVFEEYIRNRLTMMEQNKKGYIDTFGEERFKEIYRDVKNTSRTDLVFDGPIKVSLLGLFSTIFISLIYLFIKKRNN